MNSHVTEPIPNELNAFFVAQAERGLLREKHAAAP